MVIQFVKTKDEAKKITFVKTTGAGAQQVSPPSAAVSQNVSFTKSGKTRDAYDAAVRSNYAAAQKTAAPALSTGTSFASKANANLNRTTLQAPDLDPMAVAEKNQAEKTAESHKMAAGAGRSGVITETQAGFSPLKLAGGAILKGTDTAMSGLTSTANMLVGDAITEAGQLVGQDWSGNPIKALNNRLQEAKVTNQNYFQGNVDAGGKAAKIADELGTATVAAVPQALLAIATAGGGATTKGLEVVAKASGKSGILNTIGQATGTMLKDPQYWLSFLQVAGDGYDEAKADGASDREAYLFALSNGMMNAMVEVGGVTGEGGIQSLPEQMQQGGSAARKWIKTMVEEGKENVVQGIIERGLQNVVYQKGNALASVTDQNAILNPKTAAGEFASGAVVGGILGGGQLLDIIQKLSSTTRESPDTARNRSAGINLQSAAADIGLSERNVPQANVENMGTETTEKNYDIIPKMATVSKNENTKQPVKQTLEEYLGERGLSSPVSDYMLDKLKNPNGLTQRQLKKLQTDAAAAANEYATAREQVISEYNQQVATGKIVGKTRIEKLLDMAQGREENESVQAARRALQKRGIAWNENSPDTVSDRSTETPQSTVTGTELNQNITQPNGKSNGNFTGKTDIIPKLADANDSGSEPIKTGMSAQSGDTGVQKPLSEFNVSQPAEESKGNPADLISDDSADYLDNLAKDENEMTTPVTAADLAKAAMRDRLDRMTAPPENRTEPIAQSDLDDLVKLYENVANPITDTEQRRSESMENARSLVSSDRKAENRTLSQKAENAGSYFMRKMVDSGDSVTRIGKAVKDQYLYPYYNMARASASAGVNMIQGEQTDVSGHKVGESLNAILSPIRQKGANYYKAFQLYMYHLHNIDRMSIVNDKNNTARLEAEVALRDFDRENPDIAQVTEERLRRKAEGTDDESELAKERIRLLRNVNRADKLGNKPVFDYGITAQMSRDEVAKLLREHPEFTDYQQQVRTYLHNLMQYRVDSGLMTQENADFLEKYYPNYVPTYRNVEKAGGGSLLKSIRIGKTVGRAQGGTEKLLPLHTAIGQLTMKTVRESSKNRFGVRLLDAWNSNPSDVRKYISDAAKYEAPFSPDTFDSQDDTAPQKSNTFSVYRDGKLWEMQVDPSLFEAVKTMSSDRTEESVLLKAVAAQNDLFKELVTGYNPMFTVRNTVRDLQTAGLYSRDLSAFAKNYPLALKEIAENGEYWKQYKALGGVYSSVFDYQTGTIRESSDVVKKTLGRIEALNMTMEQAPRLAEFISIVKSGDGSMDNLMDAMHAAADVTVNFGRSGTLGHVLNKTFVPFLNPGIQGFDRMVRRVTETKGGKEWAKLVIRAASLGVVPTLLNALLYRDDKDWDDLRESDKDTNYLFKIGDGVWLKIPKGRELSLLGMSAQRVKDLIDGKQVNWGDFITTVGNQVAPSNPLKTNIVSAFADSALFDKSSPGKTWYRGDIESQRLQNYAPGQRYDSSTDVFSKWIGGQLNLSPKKISYILDQYSGVVGDFVLPLLTPQAERDPFTKAFTVDSVSSNRISGDFYDKGDQITFAKNAGDTSMQAVSRFWNKQVQASSDIYSQIREIENSDLSDSEKKQKVREAQAVINGIQKNALATVDIYQQSVKKYLADGGDVDTAYREANRECFGADYALQTYNKDVYGKAQQANSNGVSYDDYYQYYFDTKGFESKDGKSTSTQKLNYLESSSMGDSFKAEIYFADLASDSDLSKQEKLETDSGISRVQYWQFKAATAGMNIKADKMKAIDSLNLTSAQKTALYYAEGYAESTLDEAPWMNQKTDAYDIMPKLTKSAVKKPVFTKTASSYDIIPKLTK